MYKTWTIALAVGGLLAIFVLVLWGKDLQRASRTGPAWKRRLTAAGLAVLGSLGTGYALDRTLQSQPTRASAGSATDAAGTARETGELTDAPAWRRLVDVWKEAAKIANGKKGLYPFNEAEKKELMKALEELSTEIQALRKSGLLSDAEAELLDQHREQLIQGVADFRPTEMRGATCYIPALELYGSSSLARLSKRLPLLSDLARSGTVQPEVFARLIDAIEEDLATLEKQPPERLSAEERKQAPKVLAEVRANLAVLREQVRPPTGEFETSPQWKIVVQAWKSAMPLARSGRSSTPQRETIDKKLDEARAAVTELVGRGALSEAEAELLYSEATRLRAEIYRNPPDDPVIVMCYSQTFIAPAQQSLERLSERLPLLERLVADGKLHASVLQKVLPTVRADLAMLENPKEVNLLNADEKAEAAKARDRVQAILRRLDTLSESRPS